MKEFALYKQRLGARYFKLAFQPAFVMASIASQRAIIKSTNGKSKVDGRTGVDYKRELINEVIQLLSKRRRELKRFQHQADTPSLSERLTDFKYKTRLAAVNAANIRYGDHIRFDTGAPAVHRNDVTDWDYYSKRTKYAKQVTTTTLTLPADWWAQMRHLGESGGIVDGLMTLSAQTIPSDRPGISLFKAIWIEQGAGYHLKLVEGVIASTGEIFYHGKNSQTALRGLIKKLEVIAADQKCKEASRLSSQSFIDRFINQPFYVSIGDARDSGSCKSGIESWCALVGIDIRRQQVPVKELLIAYASHPRQEVRAAVIYAARRHQIKQTA